MRRALLLLLLLAPLPSLAPSLRADEGAPLEAAKAAPAVTGRLETIAGQPVLTLWGTPRERGFAHGYLLAEPILAGITHDFERILRPMIPRYEQLVRTLVVPRFSFADEEREELEGLFEGVQARLPPDRLVLPALGRKADLRDLLALNTFGDWYGLGCSSLVVWGELTEDGEPLVGRNFDFPAFDLVLGHQVVVVRAGAAGARGLVGVSYPGCVGLMTGMNADGVFVSIHDVPVRPTLDKALRRNVPRLLALRRLLERVAGEDPCGQALALARSWPTLYGNNLLVVGPRGPDGVPCAGVLEYDCRSDLEEGCSLRCAACVEPGGPPVACLACTNHHRLREEPPPAPGVEVVPRWRYDVLDGVTKHAGPAAPLDVDGMFGWMMKVAFPREGKPQQRAEGFQGPERHHGTLHQAVAEPAARRLHVRLGRVGVNIGDVKARTIDVPAALAAAK